MSRKGKASDVEELILSLIHEVSIWPGFPQKSFFPFILHFLNKVQYLGRSGSPENMVIVVIDIWKNICVT